MIIAEFKIVPKTYIALRKTKGDWTLLEINLLRRAGVRVHKSRLPDIIVVSGEPSCGTISKTIGHTNFVIERALPDGFSHLEKVSETADLVQYIAPFSF